MWGGLKGGGMPRGGGTGARGWPHQHRGGSCQQAQPPTWRPKEHHVPEEAAVDFSKPTLDSVHTEPACVWSLGKLHGSSISVRPQGEKEGKNTFKRQSFKSVIGF